MPTRILFSSFLGVLAFWMSASAKELPQLTNRELCSLVPAGYASIKLINHDFEGNAHQYYVAALSDSNPDRMEKPITLLLINWDGRWIIRDSYVIQGPGPDYPPNYLDTLRTQTIGQTKLLYVASHWWGGGSGSDFFYSFFLIHAGKFKLLKQFEHERMMRLYFYTANDSIYDAVLVKKRGPKRGKSYIYTCYLDVSKYSYDGKAIVKIASEKLREMTGNRFLDEKYWCMSLRNALMRGEAFLADFQKKP